MLNSFTTLSSLFSWFDLASEASASLFVSASPGAASISAVPMTAINEDHSLYVPSTAAGRAAPLVVMLHGASPTPMPTSAGTGLNGPTRRAAKAIRLASLHLPSRSRGSKVLIMIASTSPACQPAVPWPPCWGIFSRTYTPLSACTLVRRHAPGQTCHLAWPRSGVLRAKRASPRDADDRFSR